MRAHTIIACSAALLSGCATPTSTVSVVSPAIAGARTFAMAPGDDEAGRTFAPIVAERLKQFGFQPGSQPDLVVTIAASERTRNVGAFTPSRCQSWAADPRKPWLIGGGTVETLLISMASPNTGEILYRASAAMRSSSGAIAKDAATLVRSALATDPHRQPAIPKPC